MDDICWKTPTADGTFTNPLYFRNSVIESHKHQIPYVWFNRYLKIKHLKENITSKITKKHYMVLYTVTITFVAELPRNSENESPTKGIDTRLAGWMHSTFLRTLHGQSRTRNHQIIEKKNKNAAVDNAVKVNRWTARISPSCGILLVHATRSISWR